MLAEGRAREAAARAAKMLGPVVTHREAALERCLHVVERRRHVGWVLVLRLLLVKEIDGGCARGALALVG